MRVLIIGGAGMLGQQLLADLLADPRLETGVISTILLADRVIAPYPAQSLVQVEAIATDIVEPEAIAKLAGWRADVVFNLAAIVSGEAEADFATGYRINVTAFWNLLEAFREAGNVPRVVFTSSLAVYGGDLPAIVPDDYHLQPQSSYGAQKAMGEILLADYSRKGFVDGISIRLPTIVIRPGLPNRAASSFLSGILREPLNGQRAVLPVEPELTAWIASPHTAIRSLRRCAEMPKQANARTRSLVGRGISVSVSQMLEALNDFGGPEALARIDRIPDAGIGAIVQSWPRAFAANAARDLGFPVDESIHAIVKRYVERVI